MTWYVTLYLDPFLVRFLKYKQIAQYIYRFQVQTLPRVDFTLVFMILTRTASTWTLTMPFCVPPIHYSCTAYWTSWNSIRMNGKHTACILHASHPPDLFDQCVPSIEPMRKHLRLNSRSSSHNLTISASHTSLCLVVGIVRLVHLDRAFHNFWWVHPQLNIFTATHQGL